MSGSVVDLGLAASRRGRTDGAAGWGPGIGVVVFILSSASPAGAQDVEVSAMVMDRPLPTGYYQRVARHPDFFTVRRGWIARARAASDAGIALDGTLPIVVVLAMFADSPESGVPASGLQRALFDGPNTAGTLAEFYTEQSGGRFSVAGQVLPWVRSALTVAEVRGASFGLGGDARTGEFLAGALAAADGSFDFGAFDNDGPDGIPNSGDDDGYVDALAIEFLEAPITCAGQGPTIWAHRASLEFWNGEPFTTNDLAANGNPILADDYITQAAVSCDGRLQNAVVIAHELGHLLGLPDLYDGVEGRLPEQRNWVVGCWSIMAAGQWGCGEALAQGRWDRPTHFGPWEKGEFGWLPNERIVRDALYEEFTLRPVETTGDVLRLELTPQEYLLVEYRDGSGFDVNLPAVGVLVHHVDLSRPSGNRRCRGCPTLYRVALLEADADGSLITPEGEGGSRGEPGDIFTGSGPWSVTNTTTPSTRLNSGAPSDVTLYGIAVEDGVAKIRLSTRTVALDRLLDRFIETDAGDLTVVEQEYLDAVGNRDGRYDLGDLTIYLREHPSVVARAGAGGGN